MSKREDSRAERMGLFGYSECVEVTPTTEVFICLEPAIDMSFNMPPKPRKSKRINKQQKRRGFE